jgi:hypothetical protein
VLEDRCLLSSYSLTPSANSGDDTVRPAWTTSLGQGKWNAVKALPDGSLVVAGEIDNDVTVAKLADASGQVVWWADFGLGVATALAISSDGTQIAVAAQGVDLATLTGEFFVAKLEAIGAIDWDTVVPGRTGGISLANDVAFDPNGDIIAGGHIENLNTSRGFAVAKLNQTDGSVAWSRTFSGPNNASGAVNRLRVDTSGDVVAVGRLTGEGGGSSFYVQKLLGDTGAEAWAEPFTIPSVPGRTNEARAVAIDSEGNIAVAGTVWVGGSPKAEIVKLDGTTGSAIWENSLTYGTFRDVAIDQQGDVFTTGLTVDVRKYSGQTGQLRWGRSVAPGGGYALTVDSAGAFIVVGIGGEDPTNLHFIVGKVNADATYAWRTDFDVGYALAVTVDGADNVGAAGFLDGWDGNDQAFVTKLNGSDGSEYGGSNPSSPAVEDSNGDGFLNLGVFVGRTELGQTSCIDTPAFSTDGFAHASMTSAEGMQSPAWNRVVRSVAAPLSDSSSRVRGSAHDHIFADDERDWLSDTLVCNLVMGGE